MSAASGPAVTIRRAQTRDAVAVTTCLAAAFEPYRASYTPDMFRDTVVSVEDAQRRIEEMTVLVAEDPSGRILGTLGCQVVAPGEGHLRGMAVMPEFHGRGIAARLLVAAETELRGSGCVRVTLDTTEQLERAQRFYVRNGYRATGAVMSLFGMSLFVYEKNLKEY